MDSAFDVNFTLAMWTAHKISNVRSHMRMFDGTLGDEDISDLRYMELVLLVMLGRYQARMKRSTEDEANKLKCKEAIEAALNTK